MNFVVGILISCLSNVEKDSILTLKGKQLGLENDQNLWPLNDKIEFEITFFCTFTIAFI